MPLQSRTQLGPYEILAPIGAGGMGEVYKARDTRLDRTVPIKVLPEHVAADPDLKQRFEREAKTISSLNHPHICTLYDIGEQDGIDFLVMEYLEGDTLAQRLEKGALPLDQALKVAIEIADALDKAHRQGITHRDLKPGNIMLTKAGAKLLDFGLAKLRKRGTIGAEGYSATTESAPLTARGSLLGTLPYMAPEQLEGKEADHRTDIFAFGAQVYEMATGQRAFTGESQASLIAAILERKPVPISTLQPMTPARLDEIVTRCLAKDPEERWQSAADLRHELVWIREQPAETDGEAPRSRNAAWLPWAMAAIASGVALVAFLRPDSTEVRRPSEFVISLTAEIGPASSGSGFSRMPVPSPDGRSIVFNGNGPDDDAMLWVRPLESAQAGPLAGTEGATGTVIWSPDGEWIGFFADGRLKKIRPGGGPPETIAALRGFLDADWGSQGDILFRQRTREPLYVVHETGGAPRQVTQLDVDLTENSHRGPEFLPDGRRFLFTSRCAERGNNAVYVASLDSSEVRRLMPAEAHVSYLPSRADRPGALFYYSAGSLMARPFDADRQAFIGEPAVVSDDVAYNPASINAGFRVSGDGSVIIVRPAGGDEGQLTWFRRDGEEVGSVGPAGRPGQPRISPNGEAVLFTAPNPQNGNRDVWHTELARGITTKLTTHIANDWHPVWSPDGSQILFASDRDGGSVYLKTSLDPGAAENPVPEFPGPPQDWSRDGRWMSYFRGQDVWVASLSGVVETFPFLETSAWESNLRFSPDGRWVAYSSNETGRWEVHVRPFDGGPAGTAGRVQLSNDGGDFPVWGPDGRELFYMSGDDVLYAVDTANLGGREPVTLPSRLFQVCPDGRPINLATAGTPYASPYDTLDGEQFLISCREEPVSQFLVMLDWVLPQ